MDILNKKGVVFTFIVVVLVAVMIIAFLVNISTRTSISDIQTSNIKTETLNSFVKGLYSDQLPNALQISSNQAMLALLDYEEKNTYVDNVNEYFREVMNTGYYKGRKQNLMFDEKNNPYYTFSYALEEIKKLAQDQGTVFEYSPVNFNTLEIKHVDNPRPDPWQLSVKIALSYTVKDLSNEISWAINNRDILSNLNVTKYRDPLYLVEEEPSVSINITATPYSLSYFSDINNFNYHIRQNRFTENPSAPSFMQRLQGDFKKPGFTSDGKGIESLLDYNLYGNPSGFSNADYQFYTNVIGSCVKDMPANFKLDQAHITYYGRSNC